jgi:hypothetical protein
MGSRLVEEKVRCGILEAHVSAKGLWLRLPVIKGGGELGVCDAVGVVVLLLVVYT